MNGKFPDMTVTIDVRYVPELIWGLRKEMASIIRQEAEAESDIRVQRRLHVIAAVFETGQRETT